MQFCGSVLLVVSQRDFLWYDPDFEYNLRIVPLLQILQFNLISCRITNWSSSVLGQVHISKESDMTLNQINLFCMFLYKIAVTELAIPFGTPILLNIEV